MELTPAVFQQFGVPALMLAIVTGVFAWLNQRGQRATQHRLAEIQREVAETSQATQIKLREMDVNLQTVQRQQDRLNELQDLVDEYQDSYWDAVRELATSVKEGRAVDMDKIHYPSRRFANGPSRPPPLGGGGSPPARGLH